LHGNVFLATKLNANPCFLAHVAKLDGILPIRFVIQLNDCDSAFRFFFCFLSTR